MIRKATAADLDLVVSGRLDFLRSVRATEILEGEEQLEAETRSFVLSEGTAGRLYTWIAEDAGQFVGLVSVLLWPRPPRPGDLRQVDGYIINMFVRPDRQRRGVGARLLRQCLDSAGELGVSRYVLNATDEGRHLYESADFRPTQSWMALAIPAADERSGASGDPGEDVTTDG